MKKTDIPIHPITQPANDCSRALIVVAKQPSPGSTKTRLTPSLSPQQAASLYENFLLDVIDLARQVEGVQQVVAYFPLQARGYFGELAPDFDLILQSGDDLGARLDNSLNAYLANGYAQVVIMSSDSPTLPLAYLLRAFQTLDNGNDVVMGPCDDGGYYLIGLKSPSPRLLREVRMSTHSVITDTLEIAAQEGLRVGLIDAWYDVDEVNSLARLVADLKLLPSSVARHTRAFLKHSGLEEG